MTTNLGHLTYGKDVTNLRTSSNTPQANLELPSPPSWITSVNTIPTTSGDYNCNNYDHSAHEIDPSSLIHELGLPEEERSAVRAAVTQLHCFWHDGPMMRNAALCSEVMPNETWGLLLDQQWRDASIRGKY
jgi:hypothetical protein